MGKYRKMRDISKIITDVIMRNDPAFSFYTFDHHIIKAQLSIKSIRKELNQITFQAEGENLINLQEMISGSGKINIYLPSESILFSVEMKHLSDDGVMLTGAPELIYSYDRREDERYFLENPILINFKWRKKIYTKECYDISLGGLSLVFSKGENVRFNMGEEISDLKICFGNTHMPIKGKVVGRRRIDPFSSKNNLYSGIKFSVHFQEKETLVNNFIKSILEGHSKILTQTN